MLTTEAGHLRLVEAIKNDSSGLTLMKRSNAQWKSSSLFNLKVNDEIFLLTAGIQILLASSSVKDNS